MCILFLAMAPLMVSSIPIGSKRFWAVFAFEWSLSRVSNSVIFESCSVVESSVAETAFEDILCESTGRTHLGLRIPLKI